MAHRETSDQVAAKAAAMLRDPLPTPQIEVLLVELGLQVSDENVAAVRRGLAPHLLTCRSVAASAVSQAEGPEA